MSLVDLKNDIKKIADPEKAHFHARYFKTGEGQYGYGDLFLGMTVPQQRIIAKKHRDLSLPDITTLLTSKYHEERLIALFILVLQFAKADERRRKEIYDFYLSHTKYINNWDLVDSSAAQIVGEYLYISSERSESRNSRQARIIHTLTKLAKSESVWERRIAIIATYAFIKNGQCDVTFRIAELMLRDKHDLIHKAVGWMLREAGKRCSQMDEEKFLKKHYHTMPRTALRYAIEHFDPERRKAYMSGAI